MIFQNYHRHSTYTNPKISDSIVTNEDYAKRAVELGHGIISTMEHGYQGRYIEGYRLAKQYNLKFLFGTEAYWVKDRFEKDGTNCHIFIGAKNDNGRRALNSVLSEANLTGFYKQARLDIPLIKTLPQNDVWITTACVAFHKYENTDDIIKEFHDYFGDNFFLEVQYHNTDSQKSLNEHLLKLKDAIGAQIIMGCDSHYIFEKDANRRDEYLISKGLHYEDEEGWYLDYPDGRTAYNRFAKQGVLSDSQILEAMNNTNVFLQVEEYHSDIFNDDIKMPSMYKNLRQEDRDEIFKKLVWSGWDDYKKDVPVESLAEYEKEIKKEVRTVIDTHTSDYFIINNAVIKKGIKNGGVLTESGRGSAVSFFINKLLGFTGIDRIAASVKMYPERFMSSTRILASKSLPDIDFNVANAEPFALAQKQVLGEDHAYPMLSYGTLKKSAAWKLYAKAKRVPFELANEVSKQIKKYEEALKKAEEDEKDTINVLDYIDKKYHEIFSGSKEYQGIISSWSIAPCSYLLYDGNIKEEIGLVRIKKHICCLMDGHWAEEGHFLKNDLLTVKVVDITQQIFQRIGIKQFKPKDLLSKVMEDDLTWSIYDKGCTIGVNQVEQSGTSARVGVYKPRNISELCAFIAAIRPGFKSMYKTFEARKPFNYGVKAVDNLLQTKEMPNSFCLYQEQEMAALNFAGIEMSECYTAIKNIAKKRTDKVLTYKEKFIDGFTQSIIREGREKEEAAKIAKDFWKIIEDSASYSFNASHSYCMAIDSLYCAWLKSHYPLEFYEVYLKVQSEKGDKNKILAAKEEAEKYFGVKFPPFRYGQDNRSFQAHKDTNTITNSLTSIKGYGKTVGSLLYECSKQSFTTFIDVLKWLDKKSFKSSKIFPLIKIDYFSAFGNIPYLLEFTEFWDYMKQGTAKEISKEKLPEKWKDIIIPFSTDIGVKNNILKSYTITNMDELLKFANSTIKDRNKHDYGYCEKAFMQNEVLGYIDLTTGKKEDIKKIFVMEIFPLPDRFKGGVWKYNLKVKSIGTGKIATLSMMPMLYEKISPQKGDVLSVEIVKDKKGYWNIYEAKKIMEKI